MILEGLKSLFDSAVTLYAAPSSTRVFLMLFWKERNHSFFAYKLPYINQNQAPTLLPLSIDWQVLHRAVLDSWGGEGQDLERVQDRIHYIRDVIHWGIASIVLWKS